MSVPETLRRLNSGLIIVMILAVSLPAWADGEAEQITRANQLIDDKKYDDAIAILTPIASSADPIARQAKEALEGCYRRAGQWDKAIPILESLTRDYPAQTAEWKSLLTSCYAGLGDYPKAVATAKEGIEFTPATPRTTANLAEHLYRCYVATNDWGAAVSIYQSLLDKRPQDAVEWHYQLSRCYGKMGKSAEASAALAKAMELLKSNPGEQVAYANRLIDESRYDDAIGILTPITSSVEPISRQAKESLEGCYRRAGQWGKAIPILESLVHDYPADTSSWQALLASCYAGLGDYPKAVAAAKEGLDFTPATPRTTANLAEHLYRCYLATNDWDAAVSVYQSLLDKQPQFTAEWHYELGRCYRKKGKNAEAVAALEKALELVKLDPEAVKRMGPDLVDAYTDAGEWAKAEALRNIAYTSEYIAGQMIQKAYGLQNNGECAKAIPAFQQVIDRFPDYPNFVESAHVCIAECLQSLGKPEEGLAYAKKLYDEQPKMRAGALFAQGVLSFLANDYDASVVAFRRVIAEYPGNHHAGLARPFVVSALEEAGRTDQAVETLRQMSTEASDPELKTAPLLRIGVVYQGAKKYRDAISAFKKVRELKDAPAELKAEATYRSGLCYQALKYYRSARTCMDQVTKLYPDSNWGKKARGALYVWANFGNQMEVR